MRTMKVSSPELTALDLVRYVHVAGGVDAVATVLADLGGKIVGGKLAALAAHFDRAHVQRLGYCWIGSDTPGARTLCTTI